MSAGTDLLKDWRQYMLWWCLLMGLLALTQPVTGELEPSDRGGFWTFKSLQFVWGVFFGAICAQFFTLGQNTLNVTRSGSPG